MLSVTQFLALLTTALLAAAHATQPKTNDGYTPTTVPNGGTIVGVVTYDGPTPERRPIDVTTKEEVCHKDPIYSEKLVVSEDNGLRWAVVSIAEINTGKPFPDPENPDTRPTLDQKGCTFSPHVVVVPRQQPLTILNSDGVLHNVHTWSRRNRAKNVAMPGMIKEMKLKFRRTETIRVTCDIHPWMEAWIVISDHPYHAVTDEIGAFRLTDVPPGTYVLRMWHESFGPMEKEITVRIDEETRVTFALSKADRLKEGNKNGQ